MGLGDRKKIVMAVTGAVLVAFVIARQFEDFRRAR
jgi:hypothetical protein